MKFKALIKEADVREVVPADLDLPAIRPDGKRLLQDVARRFSSERAAYMGRNVFDKTLEITSYPDASGPWYSDRQIRFLIWTGDLTIDGDLLDDDFEMFPLLVVRGDLSVRNWLRGGMPAFVGGSVRASGFIVGHYNDSALFVGGDLSAAGYLPRAKPYPDFPKMAPHQIAGKIEARKVDLFHASDEELRAAFVDDVLTQDGEDLFVDEKALIERSSAGLPVWRWLPVA